MDDWELSEMRGSDCVNVSVMLSVSQKQDIDKAVSQGIGLHLRLDTSKAGGDIISLTKVQMDILQKTGGVFMTAEQLETSYGKKACIISVTLTKEQKDSIENAKREFRGLEITVMTSESGKDKLPLSKKMLAQMTSSQSSVVTFFYTHQQLSWIELGGLLDNKWFKPVKRLADIASTSAAGAFGSHSGARLGEKLFGLRGIRFR